MYLYLCSDSSFPLFQLAMENQSNYSLSGSHEMKARDCANFLVDNYKAWIGAKQELLARYISAHKDSSLELSWDLTQQAPLNIEL